MAAGGFWAKLFGSKPSLTEEEKEAQEFAKLEKLRDKGRQEYYSTRESILGARELEKRRSERKKNKEEEGETTSEPSYICSGTGGTAEEASKKKAKKARSQREPIVFESLKELPDDVLESLQRMKCAGLEEDLDVLANILSFSDNQRPKRKFYTKKQHAVVSAEGYSKSKACNRNPPRMLSKHKELFEQMTLKDIKKLYKFSHFLGEGGFGGVLEARVLRKALHPGVPRVAIKYQKTGSRHDRQLVDHEASIMAYCRHECIVRLFCGYDIGDESWLVMELLSGGTLKQAAESSNTWTEPEIAYCAKKMLLGILYLHENQLVHRDLKNLNVMFTTAAEVKLIDFGLCADVTKGPTKAMVGSPFWMAPEMVRGEFHSYPVDIYSFSICMLELANRQPPNSTNVKRALWKAAKEGIDRETCGLNDPGDWSEDFKDFLRRSTHPDPSKRAAAKELLNHAWLQQRTTREHMGKKLSSIFTMNTLAVSGI